MGVGARYLGMAIKDRASRPEPSLEGLGPTTVDLGTGTEVLGPTLGDLRLATIDLGPTTEELGLTTWTWAECQ